MDGNNETGTPLSDRVFIVGLVIASALIPILITRLHFFGAVTGDRSTLQLGVGILTTLGATFFVGFNLYTSFLRPWLFQRSHGSLDGYQYVSGAPALSSILIGISAFFLPNAPWIGVVLFVLYVADPVGILVAAIVCLRECFSDRPNNGE